MLRGHKAYSHLAALIRGPEEPEDLLVPLLKPEHHRFSLRFDYQVFLHLEGLVGNVLVILEQQDFAVPIQLTDHLASLLLAQENVPLTVGGRVLRLVYGLVHPLEMVDHLFDVVCQFDLVMLSQWNVLDARHLATVVLPLRLQGCDRDAESGVYVHSCRPADALWLRRRIARFPLQRLLVHLDCVSDALFALLERVGLGLTRQ